MFLYAFFLFNDTAPTEIYTLSLHDALPISDLDDRAAGARHARGLHGPGVRSRPDQHDRARHPRDRRDLPPPGAARDRKSTRLNSSHPSISYAVFCLKKKKIKNTTSD